MDEKLFKILKEMKKIGPETGYSARSKNFILSSTRGADVKPEVVLRPKLGDVLRGLSFYKPALAAGIAAFLIIMTAGVYYVNNTLNQNDLVVRASEVNASIQVRLNEIKYLLESKSDIDPASISSIQLMLERAADNLKEVSASSSESGSLAKSLEKIKTAEEILCQIDILLKDQN